MRHIAILGLVSVVVLASGALAPAPASASNERPEYGQCRELTTKTAPPLNHGKYKDGNCEILYETTKGKVEAKGNFEWYSGPAANCVKQKEGKYTSATCATKAATAHKGTFERQTCYPNCAKYTSSSGAAVLTIKELATIECTASVDKGEITGLTAGVDTVTFKGCRAGGKPCKGIVQPPEEIETTPLITTLVEPPENPEHLISTQYKNSAEIFLDMYCEGVGYFELTGAATGAMTGDVEMMSVTSKTTFAYSALSGPARYYTTEAGFANHEPSAITSATVNFTNLAKAEAPGEAQPRGPVSHVLEITTPNGEEEVVSGSEVYLDLDTEFEYATNHFVCDGSNGMPLETNRANSDVAGFIHLASVPCYEQGNPSGVIGQLEYVGVLFGVNGNVRLDLQNEVRLEVKPKPNETCVYIALSLTGTNLQLNTSMSGDLAGSLKQATSASHNCVDSKIATSPLRRAERQQRTTGRHRTVRLTAGDSPLAAVRAGLGG